MDKHQDIGKSQREVPADALGQVVQSEPSLIRFYKESPRGTKIRLLSVLFLAAGVVGTSSWIVYGLLRVQFASSLTPRELASIAPGSPAIRDSMEYTYELNQVALGFSNHDRTRSSHAQFSVVLELPTGEAREWMGLHRAQILDRLFEVGATFTIEDFDKPGGLEKFKFALKERLHADFGAHAPLRVVLKDWVMQ